MVNEAELEYVGMVLWDSHIFIEVEEFLVKVWK